MDEEELPDLEDIGDDDTYFLRYFRKGGWAVCVSRVTGETDKAGKPSKNAGKTRDVPVKWPGTLNLAAHTLLKLTMPEGVEVRTYEDWQRVYDETAARIEAMILNWEKNRQSKTP